MSDPSREEQRNSLSQQFADIVNQYQQDHRRLMEALHDDAFGVDAFEQLSARLHDDINRLKQMKAEMRRQRDAMRPGLPPDPA